MKAVAALVLGALLLTLGGDPHAVELVTQTLPAGGWSCDVDGVGVDWQTAYVAGPGYAVTTASLSDLAPSCAGAEAQVSLFEDLAATVVVAAGAATVPSSAPPELAVALAPANAQAERVNLVRVTLAGGAPPVPAQCAAMTFDRVVLDGTPRRDLVLGFAGDDRLDGGPNADCVSGGDGNDLVEGGPGRDVLLGGGGHDVLRDTGRRAGTDPGRDLLYGGPGDDRLDGGSGVDRLDGGAGHDTCVATRDEETVDCEVITR